MWCVIVCNLETSVERRPCPTGGAVALKYIEKSQEIKTAVALKLICFLLYLLFI